MFNNLILLALLVMLPSACFKKGPLAPGQNSDNDSGRSSLSKKCKGKTCYYTDPNFTLSLDEETVVANNALHVGWDTYRGAEKYQVIIANDEACKDEYLEMESKSDDGDDITVEVAGDYYVCVYAVTAKGTEIAAYNNGQKITVESDEGDDDGDDTEGSVPTIASTSMSFTDTDTDDDQLGGNVMISMAADESDITHYNLYWGSNSSTALSLISSIAKTGSNLVYVMAQNTAIPASATHLLVFTSNDTGEMATGVNAVIVDDSILVPTHAADSVSLSIDRDEDAGQLDMDIDIVKATDESDITDYVIYWGTNATTKQSGTPITTKAKTGANLQHTLPVNTAIPGGATHILVFTKNADGEMATGVNALIDDDDGI